MEYFNYYAYLFSLFLLFPLSFFAYVVYKQLRNLVSATILAGLSIATISKVVWFLHGFLETDDGVAAAEAQIPPFLVVQEGGFVLGLLIAGIGFAGLALSKETGKRA